MESSWTLKIIDLDRLETDGPTIQTALADKTGQRTVPNVFIGGTHVGGNSDLQELNENGELIPWLEKIASEKPVHDEM